MPRPTTIRCLAVGDLIYVRPPAAGDIPGQCWPAPSPAGAYIARVHEIEEHVYGHRRKYTVRTSHGVILRREGRNDVILADRNTVRADEDPIEVGMIEAAQEADLDRRQRQHDEALAADGY